MKTPEPLILLALIFGVLGMGGLAALLHATGTPIDSISKLAAVVVPLITTLMSAWLARGQVVPTSTAEAAVSKALLEPQPESKDVADGLAKNIIQEKKS